MSSLAAQDNLYKQNIRYNEAIQRFVSFKEILIKQIDLSDDQGILISEKETENINPIRFSAFGQNFVIVMDFAFKSDRRFESFSIDMYHLKEESPSVCCEGKAAISCVLVKPSLKINSEGLVCCGNDNTYEDPIFNLSRESNGNTHTCHHIPDWLYNNVNMYLFGK